jgi:hypothetical protein
MKNPFLRLEKERRVYEDMADGSRKNEMILEAFVSI